MAACWGLGADLPAATTTMYMQGLWQESHWDGLDQVNSVTARAYVTIREDTPNISDTSPLLQKSLSYFLSHIMHQRTSQINFTPSKVLLCYQRYLTSWSWFLFWVFWVFFSFFFSGSSHIKYWTNGTNVEFDHWHIAGLQLQFPFFSSIMQTDQAVF